MYSIETATIKDLFQLRKLEKECFANDAWPFIDLVGVLCFPGIVRIKAAIGPRMIGFISGDIGSPESVGWITTVGVAGEFRRQGIGRALLTACEAKMMSHEIRLTVRKSNQAAILMYMQSGYQSLEIWKSYYNGGEDGLVMRKLRAF
jgi:ribosomal protein S18 acetylase RimI-like enzyme